jgi:capsular polysaccharide biosynthesis protein
LNEPTREPIWPAGIEDDLPERLWPDGDFPLIEDTVKDDPTARLVSLSFVWAALKRRAWVWITLAVIGLIVGAAMYKVAPPANHATTTIVLTDGPNEDPQVQISSDAALAQSNAVARDVISKLGLDESVVTFRASYSVMQVADEVLSITASAPTSADAAARANAVATAFLKVRTEYAQVQEQQAEAGLNEEVTQAQDNLAAANTALSKAQAEYPPATQATLTNLENVQKSLTNSLGEVQSDVTGTIVTDRSLTDAMIKDTQVVNSALPGKQSVLKTGGIYFGGGFFGGLVLGMIIVIIGALLSSRLRSRDDVAYALGVPVRTSVGPLRRGRLPRLGGGKNRRRDMLRVVEHLRHAVPGKSRGEPVGLAVVAVDDPRTVAEAVVTLAASYAAQGKKVVLADLSSGRDAARRLGAGAPGVRPVDVGGVGVTVAVPDDGDMTPFGPMTGNASLVHLGQPSAAVTAAAADADVVLSLVTLDPSFGADHVATWATDAVPVVTAARSTAVTIRSVGEMLRIAGTRVESAVLIDADSSDETLGVWSSASAS